MPAGEVLFVGSLGFNRQYLKLDESLKTERFRPIVRAYGQTMDRVTALPAFIINLASWVESTFQPEEHPLNSMSGISGVKFSFKTGTELLNGFIDGHRSPLLNDSVIPAGVQAIFFSMLLESFVAFEALAGDIWVEAVNLAPDSFKRKEQSITIDDVLAHGLDLKDHMGDLLRESGKVNFQSLRAIRDAYRSTIDDAYKPDQKLKLTAEIRHLIAHRSGVVDLKFKEAVSDTILADVKLGESLMFTGPQVAELIDPCVRTSVQLVNRMDDWASRYMAR